MEIEPASDSSLLVRFEESISASSYHSVISLLRKLQRIGDPRIRNLHPAYASILIDFDPLAITHQELRETVARLGMGAEGGVSSRVVSIPVCYAAEFGIDLAAVAQDCCLSEEEVVRLHHSANYAVHFLGFSPGFAYLGGLPPELESPRLETPRRHVAAGSVGIAGKQTGIYPVDSPGGWRLIGRTPLRMFDPSADLPTRLHPGDSVCFVPIDRGTFDQLARQEREP